MESTSILLSVLAVLAPFQDGTEVPTSSQAKAPARLHVVQENPYFVSPISSDGSKQASDGEAVASREQLVSWSGAPVAGDEEVPSILKRKQSASQQDSVGTSGGGLSLNAAGGSRRVAALPAAAGDEKPQLSLSQPRSLPPAHATGQSVRKPRGTAAAPKPIQVDNLQTGSSAPPASLPNELIVDAASLPVPQDTKVYSSISDRIVAETAEAEVGTKPAAQVAVNIATEPDETHRTAPPRVIFGDAPIGSGVKDEPRRVASRTGAASALQDRRSLQSPEQFRVNSGGASTSELVGINESLQVLLAGENQFKAGVERDFQVILLNQTDQPINNVTVYFHPARGFQVTRLDRQAHIDSSSGRVAWVIESVPAGEPTMIPFKAVAQRTGSLVHSVQAVAGDGTRGLARISTEVVNK